MTKCYRVLCDPENYDPGSMVTMHHELADTSKDYVNQWGMSILDPNASAQYSYYPKAYRALPSSRQLKDP
jgi:hypothetical protein